MEKQELRRAILDYHNITQQAQILQDCLNTKGINEIGPQAENQARLLCQLIQDYEINNPSAAEAVKPELGGLKAQCEPYVVIKQKP